MVHHVTAMARKTLVPQDAFTAVAAVAQRVRLSIFRREIVCLVFADEQRLVDRSVRAVGPGSPGCPSIVAVVTVGAGNHTADAKRG